MAELIQQEAVRSVYDSIENIISQVEKLPEETVYWKPSEDEWSIMQIITHLAEAIPYWAGEINRIKGQQTEAWGRGLMDETRLQTVSDEHISGLTIAKVLSDLSKVPSLVEETIGALTTEELAITAPSRNPKFDGKPVAFIVDHLIVEHTAKHFGQIQRNLSKR